MKNSFFLIFFLSFIFCESIKSQKKVNKITKEDIQQLANNCPSYFLRKSKEIVEELDTLSVEEIKKITKKNYQFYKNNKQKIIQYFNNHEDKEKANFLLLQKDYKPDEERTIKVVDTYKKIVNNNHIEYKEYLKKGLFFEQKFQQNKSYLKFIGKTENNATIFKFNTEETVRPFYYSNQDTENKLTVKKVYYTNSVEEKSIELEEISTHSFPLNFNIGLQKKRIDSIDIQFHLRYLTKVDTLEFTKQDIGIEKNGITLLKMDKNYVVYSAPANYYNYYKGKILEEEFLNANGLSLETDHGVTYSSVQTAEEDYNQSLQSLKTISLHLKDISTREDVYNVLIYYELKRRKTALNYKDKHRTVLKGNVEKLKLYLENSRDSIQFQARFRNAYPKQNIYYHSIDNTHTEFIDELGNVATTLPHQVHFLRNSKNYTVVDDKYGYPKNYYFINQKNKTLDKLPYNKILHVHNNLFYAKTNSKDITLLNDKNEKLLPQKKITRVHRSYFGSIWVCIDHKIYNLINYNGKIINTKTKGEIKNITLKQTN